MRWHKLSKDVACAMSDEFLQLEICRKLIATSSYEYGTRVLLAMVLARSTNNLRARDLRGKKLGPAQGEKGVKEGENSDDLLSWLSQVGMKDPEDY